MNRPYGSSEAVAFLPAFLCGTPGMPWKETFFPPDFGGAHPSDPRLHVQFYADYFGDTTLVVGCQFLVTGEKILKNQGKEPSSTR
jgi:hypothetical protein